MLYKLRYITLLLIAAVFYSCTPGGSIDKTLSISEIKRKVNINSRKITSVDAEGNIFFETPEESNNAFLTLSIHKPDSLYAKFQGPFGITAGTIFVTRDDFVYFNALENIVIKGPSSPLNLGAVMRIKADFDEIMDAFSASLTFPDETDLNSQLTVLEDEYIVTVTEPEVTRKYWIHPDFYITLYREYPPQSNVPTIELKYSNFFKDKGINFPKKIELSKADSQQYITIDYSDFELNNNRLKFKLVIPGNAKIIYWD